LVRLELATVLMRCHNRGNFRFFMRPKSYFVRTWQSGFVVLEHT